MNIITLLSNLSGLADKWLGGRRGRIRQKIQSLKALRKKIKSQKPSVVRASKVRAIDKELEKLENSLMQE